MSYWWDGTTRSHAERLRPTSFVYIYNRGNPLHHVDLHVLFLQGRRGSTNQGINAEVVALSVNVFFIATLLANGMTLGRICRVFKME